VDVPAAAARRDAFVALVEAHARIVHKVTHTYCWSADDRADLTQEILAQLWRAYPGYAPARPFATWMTGWR
jgi:DNA-directed RNA polymerase specialized sigma24 family protein